MINYFLIIYFGVVVLVENVNWKGFLYVIIFVVILFVFFVLFYYIVECIYLKGVIGFLMSIVKK